MNILLLQNIENLRRPVWIGTVIESERELVRRRAGSLDDERGRHRLIGLADNLPRVVVDIEGSLAWRPQFPHMQNLAIASKSMSWLVPISRRPSGGRRAVRLAQHRPYRGIFGADTP